MRLSLNTHLQPTTFLAVADGTRVHVLLLMRALNSTCMVLRHSEILIALVKHVGSTKAASATKSRARRTR